jgi:hypothetical protein
METGLTSRHDGLARAGCTTTLARHSHESPARSLVAATADGNEDGDALSVATLMISLAKMNLELHATCVRSDVIRVGCQCK